MENNLNGLAAPPYNHEQQNEQHGTNSLQSLDHDNNKELTPANHVAVLKIRAWDPATPQSSHVFTCTSNVRYDDHGATDTKLSHISEAEETNGNQSVDKEENETSSATQTKNGSVSHLIQTIKATDTTHNDLIAGSFIGIHPPLHSSLSSSSSTWKINDTLYLRHNVNFIPSTDLNRLIRLMESNDPSVQTIIMDGLSSFTTIEAYKFSTVLKTKNTSVVNLSIRNSNINDEIASMLAMTLLDNTSLRYFSLEGNKLTSESAKKFFDVMRSRGNDTLQKLDLKNNPLVHSEILEAIDQFMEQREFRTKLMKKKQERDGGDYRDGPNFEHVTIVCDETILDGTYDPNTLSEDDTIEAPELNMSIAPYADESFTDYVQRIRPSEGKKSLRAAAKTLLASQRLHIQSIRNLTDETTNANSLFPSSTQSSEPLRTAATTVLAGRRLHTLSNRNLKGEIASTQSSVTTRSSVHSRNTQSRSRRNLLETTNVESLTPTSRQSSFASRSSTYSGKNSDFLEEKKRKSLAADGKIGVHQVDEAAPGRGRCSIDRRQRRRTPMTQSQRLARLSALTDGGDISNSTLRRNSTQGEDHMQSMVTLESAGESYNDNELRNQKRNASLSELFGLDDPELRVDCYACTCIICLIMLVVVMVVIYFMAM